MPVDVSLTLRVNVIGDCLSHRHGGLLGGGKPVETSPGGGPEIQREASFSRSSSKSWGSFPTIRIG